MTYKIHTLRVKIPSSNFLYPTVTMVTKKKTDGLQVDCNKRFYFQYEASEELNFAMYVMYHRKLQYLIVLWYIILVGNCVTKS